MTDPLPGLPLSFLKVNWTKNRKLPNPGLLGKVSPLKWKLLMSTMVCGTVSVITEESSFPFKGNLKF